MTEKLTLKVTDLERKAIVFCKEKEITLPIANYLVEFATETTKELQEQNEYLNNLVKEKEQRGLEIQEDLLKENAELKEEIEGLRADVQNRLNVEVENIELKRQIERLQFRCENIKDTDTMQMVELQKQLEEKDKQIAEKDNSIHELIYLVKSLQNNQNEILGEHNEHWQKLLEEKDKQIEELKQDAIDLLKDIDDIDKQHEEEVNALEAQIEKMKCCANCKLSSSDVVDGTYCCEKKGYVQADCKCPNWKLKE